MLHGWCLVPSLACHDQTIDRVIPLALLNVGDVTSLGTGHFSNIGYFGLACVRKSRSVFWILWDYGILSLWFYVLAHGLLKVCKGHWHPLGGRGEDGHGDGGQASCYTSYCPFLLSLYSLRSMELPATAVGEWRRRHSL